MKKILYMTVAGLLSCPSYGQNKFAPVYVPPMTMTSGTSIYQSASIVSQYPVSISGTSVVEFKGATDITLKPGFHSRNYTGGRFRAYLENPLNLSIVTPANNLPGGENVAKLELLEIGMDLPQDLKDRVNDYLSNGLNGQANRINPYNYEYDKLDLKGNYGISVEAYMESPTGTRNRTVYGFYYGNNVYTSNGTAWSSASTSYPWRIRFAPNETGTWACTIKIKVDNGQHPVTQKFSFTVASSSNPGNVKVAGNQRYFAFSETNEPYFPNGDNYPWTHSKMLMRYPDPNNTSHPQIGFMPPHYKTEYTEFFNRTNAVGGNFTRLGTNSWNMMIERERLGDYSSRQRDMAGIDDLFMMAKEKGIYICFWTMLHTEVSKDTDPNTVQTEGWDWHPYNSAPEPGQPEPQYNGIPGVTQPLHIFSYQDPITSRYYGREYLKRRLRYAVARWGYSTSLGMWEIATEIDQIIVNHLDAIQGTNTGYGNQTVFDNIAAPWVEEMAALVKSMNDPHPTTVSDAHQGDAFKAYRTDFVDHTALWTKPSLDIVSVKLYSPDFYRIGEAQNRRRFDIAQRVRNAYTSSTGTKPAINKPVFMLETGNSGGGPFGAPWTEAAEQVSYHNQIWASSFSGYAGPGSNWWHDAIYGIAPWVNSNPTYYISTFPARKKEKNRESLKNFFADVDLINYTWSPYLNKSTDKWVENYYLVSHDGNQAIGWFHNRSHYVNNIGVQASCPSYPYVRNPNLYCLFAADPHPQWGCQFYTNPNEPAGYMTANDYPATTWNGCADYDVNFMNMDKVVSLSNEWITVQQLASSEPFTIYIYTTSGAGALHSITSAYSDFSGKITFQVPDMPAGGTEHDYAYKVIRNGFRTSEQLAQTPKDFALNIVPNPSNGAFDLLIGSEGIKDIFIYDVRGKLVNTLPQVTETKVSLDMTLYPKGTYFVKVITGERVDVKKVVIQ
jgi:hypothetical protein